MERIPPRRALSEGRLLIQQMICRGKKEVSHVCHAFNIVLLKAKRERFLFEREECLTLVMLKLSKWCRRILKTARFLGILSEKFPCLYQFKSYKLTIFIGENLLSIDKYI